MASVLAEELGHLAMMAGVTGHRSDLSVGGHLALWNRKNRLHDRLFGPRHRSSLSSLEHRSSREPGVFRVGIRTPFTPLKNILISLSRAQLNPVFHNRADPFSRFSVLVSGRLGRAFPGPGQLNNLSIQENRLRRQREKDTAALQEHQAARKTRTAERLDAAAREFIEAFREKRHEQFDPAAFGFEFSRDEIRRHALDNNFGFSLRYHRWQKRAA